ncbi:sensor histidine kinase [Tenggerimyces flavus]|uniref:histidine kinase n=1 Tax=Tenggerimyces flavus TaxID=1708749 RepID=A0ABV7YMS0_9ACTN|nr:sensor histidine kinase [Tenggerimyces flavus]MBM7787482.1 sensor histidine kinase regulating citrate/malate metabolism [Tenggerimyces flavus]
MARLPTQRWSLARQLYLLQVLVVLFVVGGGTVVVTYDALNSTTDVAEERVTAIARTLAETPSVGEALYAVNPSTTLQPLAERVRKDTGVDFITIMSPSGTRFTHPTASLIGQQFIGHTEPALRGETFTETYTGTLGPSIRVVTPVQVDGEIRGLISVGITLETIGNELRERVAVLVGVATLTLLLGGFGTWLISRRLRRHTHDLRGSDLTRMYEYYEAVLHGVREGILLIDGEKRLTLANDGAHRLLDLPTGAGGTPVASLGLPEELTATLLDDEPRHDELHLTANRLLLVNTSLVRSGNRVLGTAVTLRDQTELQTLTGALDAERGFTESLRSQAHESANRLHTVVSLIELGRPEEAVAFATAELETSQRLTDQVIGAVSEPVLAALLLGKAASASERGVELVVTSDPEVSENLPSGLDSRDLVTVLGNLIDNAIDASAGSEPAKVSVTVRRASDELWLSVADSGPGLDEEATENAFRRGWSTKKGDPVVGRGLGLALVGQAVRRARGSIEVANSGGAVFTVRLPVPRPLPVALDPMLLPGGSS